MTQPGEAQRRMSEEEKRERIMPGMDVVGPDGDYIGQVRETRLHDFLADRNHERDLYVPYILVIDIDGRQVRLSRRGDQVDSQDTHNPEKIG